MTNWSEVRKEFPVCEKYVYLNAAGGSPVSYSAASEGKRFYDEMLAEGDKCWDAWLQRTEDVRQKTARYIGAQSNEIAFTTNTSTGMNYIAQMLKGKGEMLTMKDEFPSTTYPWLHHQVVMRMVTPNGIAYPLSLIEGTLTPETRILVSSHVQYGTGFRQDLTALGEFCRDHNLVFVVNATQSMGIFDIDVVRDQIDFLIFTGLKWATAGYGIAGLYVAEKWMGELRPPVVGWRSVHEPGNMDNLEISLRSDAAVIEGGCPHFPNIFALGGALSLFERIGKKEVESRVLYLSHYLEQQLTKAGVRPAPAAGEANRSGIIIVETPNAREIAGCLAAKNILVSARGRGVRISVSIFNNEKDIDILSKELSAIKHKL